MAFAVDACHHRIEEWSAVNNHDDSSLQSWVLRKSVQRVTVHVPIVRRTPEEGMRDTYAITCATRCVLPWNQGRRGSVTRRGSYHAARVVPRAMAARRGESSSFASMAPTRRSTVRELKTNRAAIPPSGHILQEQLDDVILATLCVARPLRTWSDTPC